ncbi:MAG TPA: hypothetical protein VG326_02200 [Tepidisphaeraceae bacterium]|jgi:hypothetical protein|nr:hypothetical protein [Tepidisphaeraceae bacterium]
MDRAPISISLILVAVASLAVAQSAAPDTLLPVPKYAEQNKADRAVREKYKTELASRAPADRLALAHQFNEMAIAGTDPATQYVLFRLARDCAVNAGAFPYAMSIVDDTARVFAINAPEMKASALSIGIDTARGDPATLAGNYLKVADDALAKWDPDLASKAAYLAHKLARGNPALLADSDARDHAARLESHEVLDVMSAQRKLARDADDPQANFLIARHLCFHLNRCEIGLPYLAKSAPGKLKDLADKDLSAPSDPAAMAALADEWWDYTDPKGDLPLGSGHRRAAYWYAKALPGLSAERKAQAEKRIAESK